MSSGLDRLGPYRLVRHLASGGMAETYLGVSVGPGGYEQRVCLKLIRAEFRNNTEFLSLFEREAAISASLRHSNVVSVIDYDPDVGYLVLEYVAGVDLRGLLVEQQAHRFSLPLVVYIVAELCKALDVAHNRTVGGRLDPVIHRDISPSNVLVSYRGEVKLGDFGIARALGSDQISETLRGKLPYMSPEMIDERPLDHRSDLFSLGTMMYELLCGSRPFDRNNEAATLHAVHQAQAVDLAERAPHLPVGAVQIVQRLLARDPDARFQSAQALEDALARLGIDSTLHRQLGALVSAARPPETLIHETAAIRVVPSRPRARTQLMYIAPEEARVPQEAPVVLAKVEGLPQPPHQATEPLPDGTAAAPPLASVDAAPGERQSAVSARSPWRRRGALLALSAALAMAALVLTLRSGATPRPTSTGVEVVAAPMPAEPVQDDDLLPVSSDALVEANLNGEEGVADDPPGASLSIGPRLRSRGGELQVGIFPWGRVWVDGELHGRAPLRVKLPAGRHVVEAGYDEPLQRKVIELAPARTQELVFKLADK